MPFVKRCAYLFSLLWRRVAKQTTKCALLWTSAPTVTYSTRFSKWFQWPWTLRYIVLHARSECLDAYRFFEELEYYFLIGCLICNACIHCLVNWPVSSCRAMTDVCISQLTVACLVTLHVQQNVTSPPAVHCAAPCCILLALLSGSMKWLCDVCFEKYMSVLCVQYEDAAGLN